MRGGCWGDRPVQAACRQVVMAPAIACTAHSSEMRSVLITKVISQRTVNVAVKGLAHECGPPRLAVHHSALGFFQRTVMEFGHGADPGLQGGDDAHGKADFRRQDEIGAPADDDRPAEPASLRRSSGQVLLQQSLIVFCADLLRQAL